MEEFKEKLARCCRLLYGEGLMDQFGHVSLRLPGEEGLLINPLGVAAGEMTARDVIRTDLTGKRLTGERPPPGELAIHTGIYRARPEVRSVLHFHPHYVTVLGIAGIPLRPVYLVGSVFGEEVPVYDDPALILTDAQGDAVARALGSCRAVMFRGHGAAIVGEGIEEVFTLAIFLEENARKLYMAAAVGQPRLFTADEIRRCYDSLWGTKLGMTRTWAYAEFKSRHQSSG